MARHGQFYKGFFQFAREAAWGTDLPATHRLRFLDITPDVVNEVIKSDAMDGTRYRAAFYTGPKRVRVTVELELTYTGMLLLLDGLMGTDTYGANGGISSGTPDVTHVFRNRDLFNSYVLELGMGDIPLGMCEQAVGAKLIEATLSGAQHGVCRARLVFLCKDYSTNVTPTAALTAPSPDPVLFDQLSSFNDGLGAVGNITAFELSINNMLSVRDYGSALIDEPLANGFPEITLKITEEFQTRDAFDAQVALTQGGPFLTFTTGAKQFKLSIPKAYLVPGVAREKQGQGRMTQVLTWEPIKDAGAPAGYLTFFIINTQASISA